MSKYADQIIIIFLLIVLIPFLLFAQDDRIEFVPIETDQGISNDYFNWILQDSNGEACWFTPIPRMTIFSSLRGRQRQHIKGQFMQQVLDVRLGEHQDLSLSSLK